MKKFFVAVLCIAVAAIAGYGIKYALTPVNTQKIEYITHEDTVNTKGYIVLDEWLMLSRSAGTFYHSAQEGGRVAKDSVIGELFYGDVSEDQLRELTAVDERLKHASDGSVTEELDSSDTENSIYRRENDIIEASGDNDITAISKYKQDINSLRKDNRLSSEGEKEELSAERESILGSIGLSKEQITAQMSGVLTLYTDGFEELLRLSDMENYTVEYLDTLPTETTTQKISSSVDVGDPVCRVVNNHMFYVMMAVPTDKIEGCEVGGSVTLRFNNMAGETREGTIRSVSGDTDGRTLMVVVCPDYLENAFSYRIADVDLIFASYSGYKIPVQAIRTEEDGRQKVIGIKNNVERDCYFDLVYTYTDGGYAIVRSSEDSRYKIEDMDRIVVGER